MPETGIADLTRSGEDIRTWRRAGAVLLRGVLAPEWVELATRRLDEICARPGELASTRTGGHPD